MCKKTTRRLLAGLLAVMAVLSIVSCSSEEPETIVEADAPEIVLEAPEPEIVEPVEPVAQEEIVEPEPPVEPEEVVEPVTEEPAAPVVVAPVIVEPEGPPAQEEPAEEPVAPAPETHDYVLNTNTMKFHKPTCSSANKIKEKNRADFTGTRDEVVGRGFDPCGNCHP